ncbi:MAG TPA: glycoside hydrolase family 2 TIM barrel-domain containing protein [Thermomicrobiales bacterium]
MDHDPAYPRPQLRRADWASLDGQWQFARDSEAAWSTPDQVRWDATIRVPFAPETPAGGVGETGFMLACWYRRSVEAPRLTPDERLILHLGAVDERATVWFNDRLIATHEGGYTPFGIDVTDFLAGDGPQTVVVRAEDDPHDLAKPRGKQDWLLHPHAIWYPRTTGIWQTVWLERVPATRIETVRWRANLERWEIGLDARVGGQPRDDLRLDVTLRVRGRSIADDSYRVVAGAVSRRLALGDPGIDDARNELLWRPGAPTLIDAELTLRTDAGEVLDRVESYTAMRTVGVDGDRFLLNGRPLTLRFVLDQGYWPETGLTAPDDAALRRDVELAMAMGFNGARKHQKIEDPRYLAWADRLGFLVWEELPSAYRFEERSVVRLTREWLAVLARDASHPCIVAWVPFNESWGVPDLPSEPAQRDFVRALYHLTKAIDPTRPVSGNDGWEQLTTDLFAIHDYEADPDRLARRYASLDAFAHDRPGSRVLAIDGHPYRGQPLLLSEFGGIAFTPPESRDETWGYTRSESAEAFAAAYTNLLETVRALPIFSGFCYTQFADTYQEANGLLTMDRTPKFPLEQIALATRGPKSPRELERERREALRAAGSGEANAN